MNTGDPGSTERRALVKFGGDVIADPPALAAVLRDVAALVERGVRVVICHGGGPQASALQQRLGLTPTQIGGRRVTDAATLQVMKYVLAGETSVDVVAAAAAAGLRAVGVSGVSAGLVTARRRPPILVHGGGPEPVDFGLVGEVVRLRVELVEHLWAGGYVPVINSLGVAESARPGVDDTCAVYNINADTVASALAAALRVDHLLLVTGVGGVLRDVKDPTSRIARLTAAQARAQIEAGSIVGGMIPKIEEALDNLEHGVGAVHITGARGLLAEVEAPGSHGTALSR
ncbi:MAG: acetylglutamate kinase [Myxococcales bacterium]|nr:acetylglutamate kinase [Myxococcales bacterium]